MTMIGKPRSMRANAFSLSWANLASSPVTSPADTECRDSFSPAPGDKDVISQVDRLSSSETNIAPRSVRMALCSCGWGSCIGRLQRAGGIDDLTLLEAKRGAIPPPRIFILGLAPGLRLTRDQHGPSETRRACPTKSAV